MKFLHLCWTNCKICVLRYSSSLNTEAGGLGFSKILSYIDKLSTLPTTSELLHLKSKILEEQQMVQQLEEMKKGSTTETQHVPLTHTLDSEVIFHFGWTSSWRTCERPNALESVNYIIEIIHVCLGLQVCPAQTVNHIVGSDPVDNCSSVILEVSSGAGGQEAMLFTSDLFGMYQGFASFSNSNFNTLQCQDSDLGGVRYAVASLTGPNIYTLLKFEAGIHRVQRVPTTEKSGRMHTSTASVVVMPEPDNVDVVLNRKELEIDVMRSSGPGGQHVNKTESAVRVKHLPTGLVVENQSSRSQVDNRLKDTDKWSCDQLWSAIRTFVLGRSQKMINESERGFNRKAGL